MEPDTNNKPDLETIKSEAGKLFSDVTSWMQGATADAQKKFEEARPGLEEKLATAKAEAERLGGATAGAANDMGKGFMSAFEELKSAFGDAKKHFQKEDDAPAAESDAQ
jgi:ElaB/YqjD/DUF883 family membrane-anchored ribosome-binding protein